MIRPFERLPKLEAPGAGGPGPKQRDRRAEVPGSPRSSSSRRGGVQEVAGDSKRLEILVEGLGFMGRHICGCLEDFR